MLTVFSKHISADNAAYTHANISPCAVVNLRMITEHGPASFKALLTPWYSGGDILEHVKKFPAVNRITLVCCALSDSNYLADHFNQLVEIGKGLRHLHAKNVVHGAIHPVWSRPSISLRLTDIILLLALVKHPCRQWWPCRHNWHRSPYPYVSIYLSPVWSSPHSAISPLPIVWATLPGNGCIGSTNHIYGCLLFRHDGVRGYYFSISFRSRTLMFNNFTRYSNLFLTSQGSAGENKPSQKFTIVVNSASSDPTTWAPSCGHFYGDVWPPILRCARRWLRLWLFSRV